MISGLRPTVLRTGRDDMIPKLIKTEAEYKAALARIEEIFDARPNTRGATNWNC